MSAGDASVSDAQLERRKRRVAASSVAAALLLTSMKLVVGLLTGSLGILAEAAHSGLDLAAAVITLWAVRVSAQPADRAHTYGHGKFENFSALVETLLLLATCAWIIYESLHRLLGAEVEVDANLWAFLVILVSIVVDISRSRALARVARETDSQALEADALHFSTDVWSSAVVLVGLAGVRAAQWEWLGWTWLKHADSVAALGVAGIVIWISVALGRRAIAELLDTVPTDLQDGVRAAVRAVPGVLDVSLVRLRKSGAKMFVDVTLSADRSAGLEKAHDIAGAAEAAVRAMLPRADVLVHVEPAASGNEDLLTTVRVIAARCGLGAHGIRFYPHDGGEQSLELHLEVPESLSLEEAHRQASHFERAMHEAIPGVARIVSHIEPTGTATAIRQAEPAGQSQVGAALEEFLKTAAPNVRVHDVIVQEEGGELAVSFHCTLSPTTAITDAHKVTEQLENHLRLRVANLGRVVIHVEPDE